MNKNIKKIIKFYLYGIIAFSATEVLCSERKTHSKKEIIPLFNFISMNTKKKYNVIVLTLPQEENTEVEIQCDKCDKTAKGLIPDAYENIFDHRKSHQPKKNSKISDSNLLPDNNVSDEDNSEIQLSKKRKIIKITDLLNPETNPSKPKIQKIENEANYNIKYDKEYAILKFSLIDTPQKYNNIARDVFKSKKQLTIIKCSFPLCTTYTQGKFWVARNNMRRHMENNHDIKCSTNELRKKLDPNAKNETNYIKLPFSSIDTQKKYDNWAFTQDNRKTTKVIINCTLCNSQQTGPANKARSRILDHREKKHLICRCGEQYESIMQIEICKKNHH